MREQFSRFTDDARRVIVWAQEEGRDRGQDYIDDGHIMLALLTLNSGVAADALASFSEDRAELRARIEGGIPPGTGRAAVPKQVPFTPRAKKVLELTLREALRLGHSYIGAEHILLALIAEQEGLAAQTLLAFGVGLNPACAEVARLVRERGQAQPAGSGAGAAAARHGPDEFGPRLTSVEIRLAAVEQQYDAAAQAGTTVAPPDAPGRARRQRPGEEFVPRLALLEARLASIDQARGVMPPEPAAVSGRKGVRPADLWARLHSADARLAHDPLALCVPRIPPLAATSKVGLPSRLTVAITGHVPAVRSSSHYAGDHVAAAVPP